MTPAEVTAAQQVKATEGLAEAISQGLNAIAEHISPNPAVTPTLSEGPVMAARELVVALDNIARALDSIAEAIEEHV